MGEMSTSLRRDFAQASEKVTLIERAAPAPIRSESLSKTVEENPDVKPLEDEVSVEP